MLTVITQMQEAATALVTKYADKLSNADENVIDAMCDRVIEFLIQLYSQGVLSPAEAASWFSRFEGLLDHLTNAYANGFVPMLTLANGVSAWIEYVRNFVA